MRLPVFSFLGALLCATTCLGGDVPNGFLPLSKLAVIQVKAKQSKKLIAIVAHGDDDESADTADAFAKGTVALRRDCILVYTRVTDFRAQKETLPEALKTPAETANDGADVIFYVFDPALGTMVTSVDQSQIEKDPKCLTEVRKKVSEVQRQLVAAAGLSDLEALASGT